MNFEIRVMQPEDSNKVLEIYEEGIRSGNATFETTVPSWEAWDMNHLNTSRFVVCDENENIVGWCALTPISSRLAYRGVAEVSIYISTVFQNRGLGAVLLRKLILDSEENEYWTLQCSVFPENKASISLFQKNGFRIVGTREKIGQINAFWRDTFLMERRSRNIGI